MPSRRYEALASHVGSLADIPQRGLQNSFAGVARNHPRKLVLKFRRYAQPLRTNVRFTPDMQAAKSLDTIVPSAGDDPPAPEAPLGRVRTRYQILFLLIFV